MNEQNHHLPFDDSNEAEEGLTRMMKRSVVLCSTKTFLFIEFSILGIFKATL